MKPFTHFSICMLFAIVVLGVASQIAMAQDVVQVAPQQYKVLLDNESVRVLEYQSQPGEKAEMHAYPATVAYFLSPAKFKFTSPDGKTAEVEVKLSGPTWTTCAPGVGPLCISSARQGMTRSRCGTKV